MKVMQFPRCTRIVKSVVSEIEAIFVLGDRYLRQAHDASIYSYFRGDRGRDARAWLAVRGVA